MRIYERPGDARRPRAIWLKGFYNGKNRDLYIGQVGEVGIHID